MIYIIPFVKLDVKQENQEKYSTGKRALHSLSRRIYTHLPSEGKEPTPAPPRTYPYPQVQPPLIQQFNNSLIQQLTIAESWN
ncbi:MAG: hypothetical protein ABIJ30_10835 [bacterium]